jgi:hypothetical protein
MRFSDSYWLELMMRGRFGKLFWLLEGWRGNFLLPIHGPGASFRLDLKL